MNYKLIVPISLVLILLILIISGCGTVTKTVTLTPTLSRTSESNLRIAMLFDSPVADDGFSLACLRGAEQAKQQFGISLTISEAGSDIEAEWGAARYRP
jgi:hypothetical protein